MNTRRKCPANCTCGRHSGKPKPFSHKVGCRCLRCVPGRAQELGEKNRQRLLGQKQSSELIERRVAAISRSRGTVLERFERKIKRNEDPLGCWEWQGAKNKLGYGEFAENKKPIPAHRWAYVNQVGPIPEGMDLHHLCRNTSCVNPSHLQAVEHVENVRRGRAGQLRTNPSHCANGHLLEGNNVRVLPNGRLRCRECARNRNQRYEERRKQRG